VLDLRAVGTVAYLIALLWVSSCARRTSLTRDDLRSKLVSASSYAAELEMFIDRVRQGRVTKLFVQGHATQLEKELKRSAEELDHSTPQSGTEPPFQECRKEVNFLRRELVLLPTLTGNDGALQSEREQIKRSRERLADASSLL